MEILTRYLPVALDECHASQMLQREQRRPVHRQFLHGTTHGRAHKAALEVAVDEVVVQRLLGVAAVGMGIDSVVFQPDIKQLVGEVPCADETYGIVSCQGTITQVGILVARLHHSRIVLLHQLHLHPGERSQEGMTML